MKTLKFEKSKSKNKKYSVITPSGKTINFGDLRYQQFKDTALGLYKNLDHGDKKRQKNYYKDNFTQILLQNYSRKIHKEN